MAVLCFARRAFTSAAGLGVYSRKHAGLRVTLLSGVSAPAGIRVRSYSHDGGNRDKLPLVCYSLPHRALLKIQGHDTNAFLQGLITNDMGLLQEPGLGAMYAHMLNVQGRTLYDILLYR